MKTIVPGRTRLPAGAAAEGARQKEGEVNTTDTTTNGAARRAAEAHRPTLLVATDGSDASAHAGERAVGLARLLGARLHVLYVVDEDGAFRAGIHYGEAVGELEAFGRRATGGVGRLAEEAGVEHEEMVVMGDPARAILAVAEDVGADYVLMGAEGSSRLENALFGSVSEEVLRRADRPVLLVGGRRARTDPLLDKLGRLATEAREPEKPGGRQGGEKCKR